MDHQRSHVKVCLFASLAFMIEAFLKCQCSLDSVLTVRLNKADLKLYLNGWFLSIDGAPFRTMSMTWCFHWQIHVDQNPTVFSFKDSQ